MHNHKIVYLLSLKPETPTNDYWDYGFVNDFVDNNGFDKYEVNMLPEKDAALVLLPGRHHAGLEEKVNDELNKIDHVVFFCMGDEEADFEIEKINHPSIHIWVQNPHPGRHDKYNKLGTGYPPQIKKHIPDSVKKDLNVFFSGQITHRRRIAMLNSLLDYELSDTNCLINKTRGFTQGLDHPSYYQNLSRAKVAPAPSGAVIPDSFRTFEALECMAVPLADDTNSPNTVNNYWNWLFGEETPFPKYTAPDGLAGIIQETLEDWPGNMHRITAWWIKWKRDFGIKVKEQLDG